MHNTVLLARRGRYCVTAVRKPSVLRAIATIRIPAIVLDAMVNPAPAPTKATALPVKGRKRPGAICS